MWSWFEFSVSSSLISGVKGASTPPKVLICIKFGQNVTEVFTFFILLQKFSHFLYFFVINSLASGHFWGFPKKTQKHTGFCVGISPVLQVLRTWSKYQKTLQVF